MSRDRLYFAIVPDRIADHPDISPARLAVARAIIRDAGLKGYSTATRSEIMGAAKVSLGALSDALAWLREVGEIRSDKDLDVRSRRRLVLLNPPVPPPEPIDGTHQRSGARQAARMRAPGGTDARARRDGCARQESLPPKEEETPEERGREIASRPVEESRPTPVAVGPRTGTGRDEFAPLPRGGEGTPPSDLPAIAELEAHLADVEAQIAEAKGRDALRKLRIEAAGLRNDLAARREPPRPAPPPPAPAPPPCGPPPPRRVPPDDAYPLETAFALCRELDEPPPDPSKADALADHLAGRYRDRKPETVETFRAAALSIGSGRLEEIIRLCERPKTMDPARMFSARAAETMRLNRKSRRSRLCGIP